ncbi:MAG: NADH:flavin oxidoreductase, partial [Dehalococcoidia bacterium]|nr:NADH:flavin oxidoreductase [Dehalococcoidia bacterium]
MKLKVFEPLEVNGMEIPNRLGLSSLLNNPVGEDGGPGDTTVKWFEARAQGGVGLVLSGAVQPVESAMPMFRRISLALYDDKYIPGFKRIADVVHKHGMKFGVQIAMGGPMTGTAPSMPPYPDEVHATRTVGESMGGGAIPIRELSIDEIIKASDAFAATALRVKKAGADCVEIHCTHGGASLLCSFLSPYYNKRTDQYGGNWENRLRFTLETVEKVRKAVGKDFPVLIRLCGDQLLGEKGITTEATAKYIIPALDEAGIDAFDVSQGDNIRSQEGISIPMYYPRGCFIYVAEAAKKATKKPDFGVGRIVDIEMAERFLNEGKADLIFMSRQFTSDPDTVKKFLGGKADEIRKCIGCVAGCGRPCPVNYDIQDEP